MQKLIQGIHQFNTNVFDQNRAFFERLANEQRPLALFITCSDSRINPNLLTQTQPGELFILRNAGNIIPSYGSGGEAATIEYAVTVLKVVDIIICGHSRCGAIHGLLNPGDLKDSPAILSWLNHAEATRRIIAENYSHLTGEARLTAATEENVLVQLEHLRTHPCVAAAINRHALRLHGWVYKLQTGQVFSYDAASEQFVALTEDRSLEVAASESYPYELPKIGEGGLI